VNAFTRALFSLSTAWFDQWYFCGAKRAFIRRIGNCFRAETAKERYTEVHWFLGAIDEDADADYFAALAIDRYYHFVN
jgi:hypothetical protein